MGSNVVHVPVEVMRQFAEDAFITLGVPEEDARICTDVLLSADLRGISSHGVGRLKVYVDRIRQGMLTPVTEFEVIQEGPTTAVVDGHHGMGHVIGLRAMQMAIQNAKEYGMGSVAVRNSSHFGIAGYYPLMAVQEGLIGLTVTNARPSVLPTFGGKPMFGTNPIAFGAPTDEDCPFLFDAATSVIPRGKLEVLSRAEKATPAGWVGDPEGNPATDTNAILKGLNAGAYGLLPLGGQGETFGGHKGYGLAILVEILCAALQGGAFLTDLASYAPDGTARKQNMGHFFMAIDVETFTPLESFKRRTGGILRALRASERLPDVARIYTAGEKEWLREKTMCKQGIPINENLQHDLRAVRDILDLKGYDCLFSGKDGDVHG